jgi:hypothetical protein
MTDARLKKRIVRTIINEVVADIDDAAADAKSANHDPTHVPSEQTVVALSTTLARTNGT